MRSSQRAILAALNSKPKDPEPVGWMRPNDARLVPTLRNVLAAGKGVAAVPYTNGIIFLYAVERALDLDPERERGKWPVGVLVDIKGPVPQRGTENA